MVRTQVQLTEKQMTSLKRLARIRGCSLALLVREGVDIILRGEVSVDEQRSRAAAISGKFRSKVKDLSSNHDRHLAEAYEG